MDRKKALRAAREATRYRATEAASETRRRQINAERKVDRQSQERASTAQSLRERVSEVLGIIAANGYKNATEVRVPCPGLLGALRLRRSMAAWYLGSHAVLDARASEFSDVYNQVPAYLLSDGSILYWGVTHSVEDIVDSSTQPAEISVGELNAWLGDAVARTTYVPPTRPAPNWEPQGIDPWRPKRD